MVFTESKYERSITIVVITILLALFFFFQCWRIYISAWNRFPCIGFTIPFIGNILSLMASRENMLKKFDDYVETLGDTFLIWIMHKPLVVTQNVDIFEKVLSSSEFNKKASGYHYLRDWMGDGLICSDGEKWLKRRKQLTRCFHFDVLKGYLITMETNAYSFLKKLKSFEGKGVDICELATRYSLAIICESAMGVDLNGPGVDQEEVGEYIESVEFLSICMNEREQNPLYQYKFLFQLFEKGKKYYRSIDILNSFTRKIIENRISLKIPTNAPNSKNKMIFLDTLLHLYRQDEIDMAGLIEEMNSFIFAGHDTVSTTLSWVLHQLGTDKEIQEKVYKEITEVNHSSGDIFEKVQKLQYLDCVIKETLRFRPTVPMFSREVENDTEIKGIFFPRGTDIVFYIAGVNRSEEIWENPGNFNPDRFNEDLSSIRPVYSFVPFSAGPRNCIGQKFAMMELKVSLFHILLNYVVDSVTKDDDIVEVVDVTLSSLHGLKIKFTERF